MSYEEDYLMAEVAKLRGRVDALEAIVTSPKGKSHQEPAAADVSEADNDEAGQADEPERAECPACGKEVPVNKDGSLRKHQCVEPDEE